MESHLAIQSKTPGAVTREAFAAYIRTYSEPAAIHAVCEDYRAAAGIDSRLLAAARTAGQKMASPLLAVWGGKGTVGQDFDVVGLLEAGGCDGIGASTSVRTPDPGGGSRRPPCLA